MTRFISLRSRILATGIGLLLSLVLVVAFFVRTGFSARLTVELQKRGVSLARHLAEAGANAILSEDLLSLKILARGQQKTETDIVYIFFLDASGQQILAHTFDDSFPLDLIGANPLPPGQDSSVRQLQTERGPVYDVAVPVLRGGIGQVRLGMSGYLVEEAVNRLVGQILALALVLLVLGAGVIVLFAQAITGPVRRLTRAVESVSSGSLEQAVEVRTRDEVGLLAASFNRMTSNLAKAQENLETANRELVAEVVRRRQAEGQLAAQLRFREILMEEIPLPVFFKDRQGIFIGCNRAFAEFLGCPGDAIVGKTSTDLFSAELARQHQQEDQALLGRPGSACYEMDYVRADGVRRAVIYHKATFSGEDGEVAGVIGVMQDVTREREVARLKSEFISTAAHEFQTPLATILGFTELMLEDDRSLGEHREYLTLMQQRASFLSRLVDDLLDLSRIEAGLGLALHRKPCRMEETVRAVVKSYQKRSATHRFELTLSSEAPVVVVDQERIIQVLDNLLSNAVKYSPLGSLVRVRGEAAGGGYRLEIADEGIGMTSEQSACVFDQFYRADASETAPPGTGLGLTIVKSIVEAHGGWIEVTSAPRRGTRVVITLPPQ